MNIFKHTINVPTLDPNFCTVHFPPVRNYFESENIMYKYLKYKSCSLDLVKNFKTVRIIFKA